MDASIEVALGMEGVGRDMAAGQTDGFLDELREQRFVAIKGIQPEQIEELMSAYQAFMELPLPPDDYIRQNSNFTTGEIDINPSLDTVKYWHQYRTRVDYPGKPAGVTNRSLETRVHQEQGLDVTNDPKEYFHFHPDLEAKLRAIHAEYGWGPLPDELTSFLALAQPIHTQAGEMMRQCLYAIEQEAALSGLVRTLLPGSGKETLASSPIRILAYHPGQGEELGEAHIDKGISTLALAESHQGLRIGKEHDIQYDDEKQKYVVRESGPMTMLERPTGTAAYFPANDFRREVGVTIDGMEPTPHDIINVPGKEYSPLIARYAVIFFLNPVSKQFSGKQETHIDS